MKLRHKTTTAVIGSTQWNEDHSVPIHALGALGSTETIDLANGSVQTGTVDASVTITLPAIPAGTTEHLTLVLTNSGGPWAITVESAAGFVWVGRIAPELDTANAARNVLVFRGVDGMGWIGDGGMI